MTEKRKGPPFYVVWDSNGEFPPTYRHNTIKSAEDEAIRLARLCKGKVFYALTPTMMATVEDVQIERYSDTGELPF